MRLTAIFPFYKASLLFHPFEFIVLNFLFIVEDGDFVDLGHGSIQQMMTKVALEFCQKHHLPAELQPAFCTASPPVAAAAPARAPSATTVSQEVSTQPTANSVKSDSANSNS